MQDCIFCKIVSGEIPAHKVYDRHEVIAFLDINPVNPGHTLVIPKEHHRDLLDTPPLTANMMMDAVQALAPAILKSVGADSFNVGMNNGAGAGQIVFHAHLHIMPRFANDGKELWHGRQTDQGELAQVAEDIRKNVL